MTSCAGTSCHVGATFAGGQLSMKDQKTAFTNLVGVNSTACSGEKRVVAGDASKSELAHVLQHTTIGSCTRTPMMPEGKPMLPQASIDSVVSWIQAGALNN
jgi:hypothetical protein